MDKYGKVEIGCRIVGEYIDEGTIPAEFSHLKKYARCETDLTRFVGEYVDTGGVAEEEREFQVLLTDQRVIRIRGHCLMFVENKANPQDFGSYGITRRKGNSETLVALFRVVEVKGVFTGEISAPS
jgi:hypothetical protein